MNNIKPLKVFLDPGHGGKDVGAVFRGLREADVNLSICLAAIQRIQFLCWIAMSRYVDLSLSISDRWRQANAFKADIFISVHTNADPDDDSLGSPEAKGEEIWIYQNSKQGRILAETMKDHVDHFFPTQGFRGIKETTHLGVLRHTAMPAILLEVGFIDHLETAGALQEDFVKSRVGRLIAAGIQSYIKRIAEE